MTRRNGRFFGNVLALAYREAIVLSHDKAFIAVVLAQPTMMVLLFGLVLSNKPANVPWAVLDRSESAASRRFVQEVQTTGYFLGPRRVGGYAEGRRLLARGDVLALLVVPDRFAADFERGRARVQLLVDGSDPLPAARVTGYIGQVAAAFEPRDGARALPPSAPTRAAGPIDVRQTFRFNPTLRDRNFFLGALAGMLLTNLCLSATALGLVGEREAGTFEQMLAQPTSSVEIVLGKLVPYVVVCYALLLVAIMATGLLFGVWPQGSVASLFAVTLPFVLASLSIGALVSALAHSSAQATFIATFFILPSFVLSGSMFPYQLMPHG